MTNWVLQMVHILEVWKTLHAFKVNLTMIVLTIARDLQFISAIDDYFQEQKVENITLFPTLPAISKSQPKPSIGTEE